VSEAAGGETDAGAPATPSAGRRLDVWRAPFALQVMALMAAGVLFAQIVTTLAVFVLPPPRAPIYALHDIATALQGGALASRFGQSRAGSVMVRRIAEAPPPAASSWRRFDQRNRFALAAILGTPLDQVRFDSPEGPRWGRMAGVALAPLPIGPGAFRRGPGGFHGEGRDPPPGSPPPGPPPSGPPTDGPSPSDPPSGLGWRPGEGRWPPPFRGGETGAERFVFGSFVAAWRRADGRWIIVQSPPEPFPAEWQRRILLWLVLSLAFVFPAGYLFARRITAPLGAFAQAAERFGKDLNAPPIEPHGPAELSAVAHAFNAMQGRLRRYVEDRTAMVGAISHDLRTPLARIRFKMERADEALRASVNADVTQMEAMLTAVLDFIRDASTVRARQPLDVVSLLECVVDDEALMGGDVALDPKVSGQAASPIVDGDATALKGLFANLVGNALKYGRVARVTVHVVGGDVKVEIADSGPGLPAAELERVFEPFYRTDPARNMDVGGIGLGLAVARSVARAHGGDVWLTSSTEGVTAHVQLPLGAAPGS
jgi:signal transduction histidine kinase